MQAAGFGECRGPVCARMVFGWDAEACVGLAPAPLLPECVLWSAALPPGTGQHMLFCLLVCCGLGPGPQVKALARLSLKDPEYVAVHEKAKYATPKKLVRVVGRWACLVLLPVDASVFVNAVRSLCTTLCVHVNQAQTYVVCKLEDKLNLLYSFVKTHLKAKVR